jgi:hypothetical protein
MKNSDSKSYSLKEMILFYLPYLLLFTGSLIYFGFYAGYVCFYQEKLSLFVFSGTFLSDHLNQPGGLLVYLGKFLTTFFYSRVLGAVIISLLICITSLSVLRIIMNLSGKGGQAISLLAGMAIFFVQADYHFLLYNTLGLTLQVLLFSLIIRKLKGWIPVLIFPFWYFVTGAFAWIFFVTYTVYIVAWNFRGSWYKVMTLAILMPVIIYMSGEFVFFQPDTVLLSYPLSLADTGSQLVLLLAIAGIISLVPAAPKLGIPLSLPVNISGTFSQAAGLILLLMILTAIPLARYDKKDYQYFKVEEMFYQERYNDVVGYLEKNPSSNRITNYLNNIALSETGRLNDMLFHFRQDPEGQTLFLKWEMLSEVLSNGAYFYFSTGMINEALRWAYENMVMEGMTPEGLRMMIRTEIINGNYAVASKYISILKKTVFYRREALKYEKLLFNNEAVNSDPLLGPGRKGKISKDFFTISDNPFANIELVLASDSTNRKVFEYKLAYLLLKKDHEGITGALSQLSRYGITRIPVHLEEAAVVYRRIYSGTLPPGIDQLISRNTEARFGQFIQILKNYGNNPKVAEPFLRQKFGDTFWYYVFYR